MQWGELQVMNVQMRIITEDNVDQLMSMSYSNNMKTLLKWEDIAHKTEEENMTSMMKQFRKDTMEKINKDNNPPKYDEQRRIDLDIDTPDSPLSDEQIELRNRYNENEEAERNKRRDAMTQGDFDAAFVNMDDESAETSLPLYPPL